MNIDFDVHSLVGLTMGQAIETALNNDYCVRAVVIDGKGQMKTNDARRDRLNLYLDSGIVTKVEIG